MLHVLKTWYFEALRCIGTEDLGRVFGCVEGCCFLSQTWAGHSVYKKCFVFFSFFESFYVSFIFVTFAIWGMGLYKRNVRLFEGSILSACGPVSESMRIIRTTLTHFFALE